MISHMKSAFNLCVLFKEFTRKKCFSNLWSHYRSAGVLRSNFSVWRQCDESWIFFLVKYKSQRVKTGESQLISMFNEREEKKRIRLSGVYVRLGLIFLSSFGRSVCSQTRTWPFRFLFSSRATIVENFFWFSFIFGQKFVENVKTVLNTVREKKLTKTKTKKISLKSQIFKIICCALSKNRKIFVLLFSNTFVPKHFLRHSRMHSSRPDFFRTTPSDLKVTFLLRCCVYNKPTTGQPEIVLVFGWTFWCSAFYNQFITVYFGLIFKNANRTPCMCVLSCTLLFFPSVKLSREKCKAHYARFIPKLN